MADAPGFRDIAPEDVPLSVRKQVEPQTTLPQAPQNPQDTTNAASGGTLDRVTQWLLETGKRSAAPAIGGATLGALGTAVGGPSLGALGFGLGAAGGVKANQLMGLEQPTFPDYAAAAGLGMAVPALRGVTKELPGAAGGLQEAAAANVAKIPAMAAPKQPAAVLYGTLPTSLRIPLTNLSQAAADVLANEAKVSPKIRIPVNTRMADAANELVKSVGQGAPEDVFRANLTRFGEIVRMAQRKGGLSAKASSQLFGAMMNDLDAAAKNANSPYASMLRDAADAYKHELAQDRLTDILGMGGATRFQMGGKAAPGIDSAMTKIASDPQLAKWLSTDEIKGILGALEPLAKVPNVTDIAKPGFSGMPMPMRLMMGAGLGELVGGTPMSAAGGVLVTEGLARALMSPLGRPMIRSMALHGMTWDQIGNTLGQLGRAGGSTSMGMAPSSAPVQLGNPNRPAPRPPLPGRAIQPEQP